VALPKDWDPHGNFGIQHHDSRFFLLASSSRTKLTSARQHEKTAQGNGYDREEKIQVLAKALDILVHSKIPLKVHDANEDSSPAQFASAGENNKKHQVPSEETRTPTAKLLATGLKMEETAPVEAFIPQWLRIVVIFVIIAATFASHAINLFFYPRYETDEGTYMMSAWAITHGSITPYAYGYGHSPLAWILIAGWVKLTGGFSTFGNAINSGRVLMLFFAVGSAWLVYLIASRLRLNFVACLLATVAFALSPLAITFHREVLLDNFAAFWFLLALYLIITGKSRLSHTISAAICFGFAVLSKEVLITLFPIMIYVVWLYTARFQRTFMLISFCYGVVAIGSTFVLLALLKGELIPYEWHLPWDTHPHLSLIGTYMQQAVRGQAEGSIYESWIIWVGTDPLMIVLGFAAPVFNLLLGWWNRKQLLLALFAITFWGLILRGGVVFAFYIIPLIPIIAINIAIAINTIESWIASIARFERIARVLTLICLMALIFYNVQQSLSPKNIFTLRPTVVQSQALAWIHAHVSPRAVLVVNSTLYTDLHEPQGAGVGNGAIYPYAHEYLAVATDPDVHNTLLQNNWDRIDYIVANAEMLQIIRNYGGGMNLIKTALEHSVLHVHFQKDKEFINVYEIIHQYPPPNI
jgi:hypothetical protein